MNWSITEIENAVKAKGYAWFDAGNYNLNIIGIRNEDAGEKVTNLFDDYLHVIYKISGQWIQRVWEITTDPGKKGVMEYHNSQGVARLVEGQYRGAWSIGLHKGKYQALRQVKPVKVYRDSNRDMKFDESRITEGVYGINIHKAGKNSTFVENWSEGCQVFKRSDAFEIFMDLCRKSSEIYGNSFTYTLIKSSDIQNTGIV